MKKTFKDLRSNTTTFEGEDKKIRVTKIITKIKNDSCCTLNSFLKVFFLDANDFSPVLTKTLKSFCMSYVVNIKLAITEAEAEWTSYTNKFLSRIRKYE